VVDGTNGKTFATSGQLQKHLFSLLRPLENHTTAFPPHGFGDLQKYSQSLEGRKRWDINWKENAYPCLLRATGQEI
jgi:hypothetical protein